jgi:dTDP-4-amino-4,6-dideoxygalactose transaminase
LWIIQDACHSPGGYFVDTNGVNQTCGMENLQISHFSFHPVKHIAAEKAV